MESSGASELLVTTYDTAGVTNQGICSKSFLPHIPNCRQEALAYLLLESTCSFSNLFQIEKEARAVILLALIISDVDDIYATFP